MRKKLVVLRKRFFCPSKEVDFLVWMGESETVHGIEQCSALVEGDEIDCDRSCLHLLQARTALPLSCRPLSPTFYLPP